MTTGIYEILNTANGKRYIGSAVNMTKRWREHYNSLQRKDHHSVVLQRAWNKYGAGAFKFLPILTCAPTKTMMHFYEQQLFDKVKPEYNIAPTAGSNLGSKRTPEQCARNGELKRGNKNALGLKHTPEQRENNAAAQRGKKATPETRAKLSAAKKGVPKSPSHRAALIAHLERIRHLVPVGVTRTPEQRARISDGLRRAHLRKGGQWRTSV